MFNMEDKGTIDSVVAVAGAGFRLSLVLNAVGTQIGDAGPEIQRIAKEISLFSLALKQIGLKMGAAESVVSHRALDTAREISSQSETVFNEVKEMVQMSQKRDANGHIRFISIAQEVSWCFKKQRVQYLLGQLESLKLSLSLMLQILQLGQTIAISRKDPSKPLPNEQDMRQERAEIQNIVVVRHWSLVDLRRLYQLAEYEAAHPTDNPPPSSQGAVELPGADPRLSITSSEHDQNLSKTNGKSNERSLSQLDASMKKAMHRPKILHSPGDNVVDVLLDEWTRLREFDPRYRHKSHKYPSYHTDDEEDLQPQFERSKNIGGQYIEGPANGKRSVKNVRFRAQVESDSENSDKGKQSKRPPSRHVMRSEASASSSSSSLTSSSSDYSDTTPTPIPRLNREFSAPERGSKDYSSSSRRYTPFALNTSLAENNSERPTSRGPPSPKHARSMQIPNHTWQGHVESQAEGLVSRQSPSPIQARPMPIQNQSWQGRAENQPEGPLSRGPPSPMQARTSPLANQSWQGQFAPTPGVRPPHQHPNIPPPPHRTASVGSAGMPYGSPIPPNGRPFHPPPQPAPYSPPREKSHRSRHRPPRERRQESSRGNRFRDKSIIKTSLISAGAVAGLLDILDGLGAI